MNIFIVSDWGGGLALAERFKREGHAVRMCIRDAANMDVGDGMVEKRASHRDAIGWADLVVFDDLGFASEATELRDRGLTVWGSTPYSDRLESDRAFGQSELGAVGMSILRSKTFDDLGDAKVFLREQPARYVFKPHGEAQEDKILTYIGTDEDASDMLTFIDLVERRWSGKLVRFELQEFVAGVEIGVSGFYNGTDFVDPIEISFEHKPLMNGNIGPATGEMGTTMFWTDKRSKLYEATIGKIAPRLTGYTGYLDINCIAHRRMIYPLEFTSRFGYPTIQLKLETLDGDLGDAFYRIARGEPNAIPTCGLISLCVVVATPPWPYSSEEVFDKYSRGSMITIEGARDGRLPAGVYPGEMRCSEGDLYVAGSGGFTAVVVGSGDSIEQAKNVAYHRLGLVNVPNMMYRTDIGHSWSEDINKLREWGWLDGLDIV